MKLPEGWGTIRISTGQRWRKKDTGQIIEIRGKRGDEYVTRKLNGSKKSHGFNKKTLLLFWEPIE